MPSIRVLSLGFVLLVTSVSAPLASAQGDGQHHFLCDVLVGHSKTVYASPVIATVMTRGAIMQDWHKHMLAAYSLTPVAGAPDRYECVDLGSQAEQQQAALKYDEQSWTASNYKIVHVDYAPGGGSGTLGSVAPATPDPTLTNPAAFPTVRAFMSCSTAGTGGADIYYTSVFAADLKTGNQGRGGRGAIIIDRKVVDPASVQEVLDRFQAWLKQKGDKFQPGNNLACDVRATEADAEGAKHRRAYEGGGCTSGCSKIVETGWKQED